MEFLQNGKVMHYTNPSASDPIPYLTPVVVGELVGVALAAIAPKEEGSLAVEGVFRLPAKSGEAFAVGQQLYWDPSAKQLTTTASALKKSGYAFAAKASEGTSAAVKLGW